MAARTFSLRTSRIATQVNARDAILSLGLSYEPEIREEGARCWIEIARPSS
jgi:hypothetical protein